MMTKKKFQSAVLDRVHALKISHIEAVVETCSHFGIEPDAAAKYIEADLKSKIEGEAVALNMVESSEVDVFKLFGAE